MKFPFRVKYMSKHNMHWGVERVWLTSRTVQIFSIFGLFCFTLKLGCFDCWFVCNLLVICLIICLLPPSINAISPHWKYGTNSFLLLRINSSFSPFPLFLIQWYDMGYVCLLSMSHCWHCILSIFPSSTENKFYQLLSCGFAQPHSDSDFRPCKTNRFDFT